MIAKNEGEQMLYSFFSILFLDITDLRPKVLKQKQPSVTNSKPSFKS